MGVTLTVLVELPLLHHTASNTLDFLLTPKNVATTPEKIHRAIAITKATENSITSKNIPASRITTPKELIADTIPFLKSLLTKLVILRSRKNCSFQEILDNPHF